PTRQYPNRETATAATISRALSASSRQQAPRTPPGRPGSGCRSLSLDPLAEAALTVLSCSSMAASSIFICKKAVPAPAPSAGQDRAAFGRASPTCDFLVL